MKIMILREKVNVRNEIVVTKMYWNMHAVAKLYAIGGRDADSIVL
jgi:hypothetical protein